MKKITENPKLMIALGIIIALCVVGLAFGINQIIKRDRASKMTEVSQQLIDLGVPEKDAVNMDLDEAVEKIDQLRKEQNLAGYVFDVKKKEFNDTANATVKINEYISNENWDLIVNYVNDIKNKYNFTTKDNMNIITAGIDAEKVIGLDDWDYTRFRDYFHFSSNPFVYLKVFGKASEGNLLNYYLDSTGVAPIIDTNYKLSTSIYDMENEEDLAKLESEPLYYDIQDYLIGFEWNFVAKAQISGVAGGVTGQATKATCFIGNESNRTIFILGCYSDNGVLPNVAKYSNVINGIY